MPDIRKIRRFLSTESCKILVHSLVTSRLDYANSLLCNTPDRITVRLERVQRSAVRLIYGTHRYQRVSMTAVLHDLHKLLVVLRIQYTMVVTVFKAYCSGTRQYLADLIVKHSPVRSLRSSRVIIYWRNQNILERDLEPSPSVLQDHVCGIDFRSISGQKHHWTHLKNTLRHICFENTIIHKIELYYYYVFCMSAHPLSYCML